MTTNNTNPAYIIVTSDSTQELVDNVNSFLSEGFYCQGGPFVINQGSMDEKYAQAMRYKTKPIKTVSVNVNAEEIKSGLESLERAKKILNEISKNNIGSRPLHTGEPVPPFEPMIFGKKWNSAEPHKPIPIELQTSVATTKNAYTDEDFKRFLELMEDEKKLKSK